MFLTILMWLGIGYLIWVISGYINFRIVNAVMKSRCLMENGFWEYYGNEPKVHRPLTPKIGLLYMFAYGFGGLVVCSIIMIGRGIRRAYKSQFANGFDHSLGANRFFGIK